MTYCRNCGAELGESDSFCKDCGAKTDTAIADAESGTESPDEAVSLLESLRLGYRYYTYPENRKWLSIHVLLTIATAGVWAIYLLSVILAIWSGTSSKDVEMFM